MKKIEKNVQLILRNHNKFSFHVVKRFNVEIQTVMLQFFIYVKQLNSR